MILTDYISRIRTRKAHVYCIGAAKTGTTSISHIFNGPLRSAHEPNVTATTKLVIQYLNGELNDERCAKALKQRDKKMNLELESSHPLGYFAPHLAKMFPAAKFVITIRDPRSWLKSRLNFHLHRKPDEWTEYRDFIWSRHHTGYTQEESHLEANGLYSIEAYLRQYSEQYRIIFDSIPHERRIVIKTNEISHKIDEISHFIGISNSGLEPSHTNKMNVDDSIYDQINDEFINSKVYECCGWIIDEFFSDKATSKC